MSGSDTWRHFSNWRVQRLQSRWSADSESEFKSLKFKLCVLGKSMRQIMKFEGLSFQTGSERSEFAMFAMFGRDCSVKHYARIMLWTLDHDSRSEFRFRLQNPFESYEAFETYDPCETLANPANLTKFVIRTPAEHSDWKQKEFNPQNRTSIRSAQRLDLLVSSQAY